jgi:hypothetical protein
MAVVTRMLLACGIVTGCNAELGEPDPAPALDTEAFRCRVQPVVAARCAFAECHASAQRPYRLYAVGRMRLGVEWSRLEEPLTPAELAANYEISRNFAVGEAPLLTAKPLDTRAGGYYHRGADLYGEDDVFLSTDDPGYQVLAEWIAGGTAPASCTPITEVGP